ncbi:MAG: hypothetical protein OEZ06_23805 [Myxococcales bacterium]|nr:hypothetical protein [Myxococcales bacterium]
MTAGTGGQQAGTGGAASAAPGSDAGTAAGSNGGNTTASGTDTGTLDAGGASWPPKLGDACTSNLECDAAGQLCSILPGGLGFCSALCTTDTECLPLEGVATTCDTALGMCRLDCAGTGVGDGQCPPTMECVAAEGQPGVYGCQYPIGGPGAIVDAGPPVPTGEAYAGCKSDADCIEGACVQIGVGSICTSTCADNSECAPSPGGTALAYCADVAGFDACALSCPEGTTCPTGMLCLNAICLPEGSGFPQCTSDADCTGGAVCNTTLSHCTTSCSNNSDCSGVVGASATPECGPQSDTCVLACRSSSECPEGMTCGQVDYCSY